MTTATTMQTFGNILDALSPEIVKQYRENQAKTAEKAEKVREKYGFALSDYEIERIWSIVKKVDTKLERIFKINRFKIIGRKKIIV